jgi:hypothetical protein
MGHRFYENSYLSHFKCICLTLCTWQHVQFSGCILSLSPTDSPDWSTYKLDNTCAIVQDNICVLNTALIIFIFLERNGELQAFLQALRAADMRVLQTFRSLLEFWRNYYLRKRGREGVSLQYSTQLLFSDWLHIVDLLCSHPDSPSSLLYGFPAHLQHGQCGSM